MICKCKDWKINIDILNAPVTLLCARNPEIYKGYDGKIFVYCPWCGKKLNKS